MGMQCGIWSKSVTKEIWAKILCLDLVTLISCLVCSLKLKLHKLLIFINYAMISVWRRRKNMQKTLQQNRCRVSLKMKKNHCTILGFFENLLYCHYNCLYHLCFLVYVSELAWNMLLLMEITLFDGKSYEMKHYALLCCAKGNASLQ